MAASHDEIPLMDVEANDETTSRSSKTRPILTILFAAMIGVIAVGAVYHLHEAGQVQANSSDVTNLADEKILELPSRTTTQDIMEPGHEFTTTQNIIDNFLEGFWDGSSEDYGTKEATVAPPPGKHVFPVKVITGMCGVVKRAFPKIHSKVWGTKTNADGTYTVLFQNFLGPMKHDMPKLGPFPPVRLSTVPDDVKEGLNFPVEKVIVKVNDKGDKVESAVFTGEKVYVDGAIVSPEVDKIWGGRVEGFGALYALMGVERKRVTLLPSGDLLIQKPK